MRNERRGMRYEVLVIVVSILLVLSISPAWAIEIPRSIKEPFLLTARRLVGSRISLPGFPASVSVLPRTEIQQTGAKNLAELIGGLSGVNVTDSLGFGLEAAVDLRGFSGGGSGTLVLVDGVRINNPLDNSLFWKRIPIEQVERLEIFQGGYSSIFGQDALSGIINIVTRHPEKARGMELALEGGSFGKMVTEGSFSGSLLGKFRYLLSPRFERLDGYRQNGGYEGTDLQTKLIYQADKDTEASFTVINHTDQTGTAGNLTAAQFSADPRQVGLGIVGGNGFRRSNTLVQAMFARATHGAGKVTWTLWEDRGTSHSTQNDAFGGIFTGDPESTTRGSVFQWELPTRGPIRLSSALEISQDDIRSVTSYVSPGFSSNTRNGVTRGLSGWTLGSEIDLPTEVRLTLGARADRAEFDIRDEVTPASNMQRTLTALSPRIGISKKMGALTVFANNSSSFRAPAVTDFISLGPSFFPNPQIQPARANSTEIGVRLSDSERVDAQATLFWIETEREIMFDALSGPFGTTSNFDTRRSGLELSIEGGKNFLVSPFVRTTFTDAVFKGSPYAGNRVPLTPVGRASAGFHIRPEGPLSAAIDVTAVSGQFALNDFRNIFPVDSYSVWNGRLTYALSPVQFHIDFRNIFNEKYSPFTTSNGTTVVRYNPAPGFGVTGGVQFEL